MKTPPVVTAAMTATNAPELFNCDLVSAFTFAVSR
jgi:hypothetical protein